MNTSQIVVTVIVTLLTIVALAVGTVWSMWPRAAEASISLAAHSGSWPGSAENSDTHGDFKAHCAHMSPAHLELGAAVVSAALDLDATQNVALDSISESVEALRTFAQATCENVDIKDFDSSLDSLQAMLNQTAITVGTLKPQLNDFYASLDPTQQEKLHSYMAMHHAKHAGRGGFRRHASH